MQSLRAIGPTRLAIMAVVAVALLGFFLFLTTRLTAPNFALLYGDLPMDDSGQIVTQLEAMNVPYKLAANGSQIMVPSDRVLNLRLQLAEQGLPSGGSVGYEVFDDSAGLGTTNFVQNINLLRAIEGELARTIGSFDTVRSARVHVVLPRRELFQRERNEPSASVFLRQRGNGQVGQRQVAAIQHLVAAAVPGLAPERVAVIDGRGNLLASGTDTADDVGAAAGRADEFRRGFETRLKRTVEELLERSVGFGNVRAEVSAEIDFDRVTVNEESYDPDGRVVRSTQTVEDNSSSTEVEPTVSVGNNLPEAEAGTDDSGLVRNDAARTEETVNYEISRVVRAQIQEGGTVQRLSVAVLVDGTYDINPDDETRTYVPRSEEELAQLATLVRSAIGYDEQRGDTVEVINMQFASIDDLDMPAEPLFGLTKSDYFNMIEIVVLAVVAILVILLVLRPLVTRMFAMMPAPGAARPDEALTGPDGQPLLAAPGAAPGEEGALPAGAVTAAGAVEGDEEYESLIDLNKVEGRVKASSVRKLGEIIDMHPDEALTILRGWMGQTAQ